jgi:O-antigen ligase
LEGIGQWANANDLAALIVLILPLVFFPLIARSQSVVNRLVGLFLVAFLLLGIWLSQSRGAMVAIAMGLLVFLFTCVKLRMRVLIPSVALLAVPIIFLSTIQRDSSDLSGSSSMRMEYLMTGLRMVKTSPLTGVGFMNYPKLYERYTTSFEEFGERTAHSSWVLALAETGLPGLILFVGLFLFVLGRAFLVRHIQPELLFALVSYGTCMSLLSHTYSLLPYSLFALIISSKRVLLPSSDKILIK